MASIQLTDIAFAYNGCPVLRHVSLGVASGERVALLGSNGAGKTTLLKLIGGVLQPVQGTIVLDGQRINRLPKRELSRKTAIVPQEFVVPFAFAVREVVELGRTPYVRILSGLRASDRLAVEKAMEQTDVVQFSSRVFNELSGGERQRVMIAMALAQEPELLLLDEPTQQLDITRQAEVMDLIIGLNRRWGLTVIAAIHDLNLAGRYFDRLILLHNGTVLADGPPERVLRTDFMEEAYDGPVEIFRSGDSKTPIVFPVSRFRDLPNEQ
ncbi:MAG TPA: ABC transporter ATP-binding protein [Terriglobia bacterium]|nr:ABC transporter ATP-binding protein [Terriglobia bacterium]